jgi:hypothetical protein
MAWERMRVRFLQAADQQMPIHAVGWGTLLHVVRAPAGLLAATLALLMLAPEMRDMMAGLWDGPELLHWHALAVHATLILLGISAWHWSRAVLSARFRIDDSMQARQALAAAASVDPAALIWVPRLLYVAAALVALVLAARSGTLGYWPSSLIIAALWAGGFTLLIARVQGLPRAWGGGDRTYIANPQPYHPLWHRISPAFLRRLISFAPLGPRVAIAMLGAAGLFFVLGAITSLVAIDGTHAWLAVAIGEALPGPGAPLLCLALAIAPLTALTFLADSLQGGVAIGGFVLRARGAPVLLLLLAVVTGTPTLLNLHGVRVAAHGTMAPNDRKTLDALFQVWARACGGTGQLRPVIVALSGGASRAGLWGARVLSLADSAARQAHTGVFAVSSVSGGSVGAAAYATWLADMPTQTPCQTLPDGEAIDATVMKKALRADALGPLLAGALFGDVPRALMATLLVPVHWLDSDVAGLPRGGDRAEALEVAFERNWHAALLNAGRKDTTGFARPYLSLNYSETSQPLAAPIWIANGTDQQNGERLLTVPFKPSIAPFGPQGGGQAGWPFQGAKDVLGNVGADMRLSTVIDNTCRFPLLSPVGELTPAADGSRASAKYPMQIIDGGYFDNEGLQTALELANWLKGHGPDGRAVEPIIVQATADADTAPAEAALNATIPRCTGPFQDDPAQSSNTRRANQLAAPLLGLAAARGGHGSLVLRQALANYCTPPQRFYNLYLYRNYAANLDVPLNWTLSADIADYIWDGAVQEPRNQAELAALRQTLALPPHTL